MIYKQGNYPDENEFQADVVIIGSGAGGSLAAAKLAEEEFDVIVLEEGPFVSKEDFTQEENKMVRKMYRRGGALATDDMSVRILQGKVLGGSTTINWMNCFRTPDYVLKEWANDFGVKEYLPGQMTKHFEQIEKRMNIHRIDKHSRQNEIIIKGSEELETKWKACKNNSENCIGCGKCGIGCYYDAKKDMRLTYLKDAQKRGTKIFTSCKAVDIDHQGSDKQIITGVRQDTDETLKFKTKRTIVAAGAIHTPLLLQKSGLARYPVGKFLHLHPVLGTLGIYDRQIHPTYGIPMSAYNHELKDITNGYGVWQEVPDLEVFLAGVNFPGIGEMRRKYLQQINNTGVIITLTRDGVSKKSTGEVKWRRGLNVQNGRFSLRKRPSIRYPFEEQDKKHALRGLEQAIKIHFAAGAKEVIPMHSHMYSLTSPNQIDEFMKLPMGPNQLSVFSAHPTGTARMGKNPKKHAVNERLQLYGYPGIYVMDGSILPTAPGVNPMVSILGVVSRGLELGNAGL